MKYPYHDYTFGKFESIVEAICAEILGVGVQGFAEGKDGGRDAKFIGTAQLHPSTAAPWEGTTIIQAKHTNGINQKFSDNEFFANASSVINKEIISIQKLIEADDLDNYMLFSNRSLTAGYDNKIKKHISEKTGLPEERIGLFGVDNIEKYIKRYPSIASICDLNPFTMALVVEPEELAVVIESLAETISITDLGNGLIEGKRRTKFENKNQINNLSMEYSDSILKYMSYFEEIKKFLGNPNNSELQKYYISMTEEFNSKIIATRDQYVTFDSVLNYLFDMCIKRDVDLKKNKLLTRTLLYYMYYDCDIGRNK